MSTFVISRLSGASRGKNPRTLTFTARPAKKDEVANGVWFTTLPVERIKSKIDYWATGYATARAWVLQYAGTMGPVKAYADGYFVTCTDTPTKNEWGEVAP